MQKKSSTFTLCKFQRREQTPLWKQFTATDIFVAPTKYKSLSTQEGAENPTAHRAKFKTFRGWGEMTRKQTLYS